MKKILSELKKYLPSILCFISGIAYSIFARIIYNYNITLDKTYNLFNDSKVIFDIYFGHPFSSYLMGISIGIPFYFYQRICFRFSYNYYKKWINNFSIKNIINIRYYLKNLFILLPFIIGLIICILISFFMKISIVASILGYLTSLGLSYSELYNLFNNNKQ